MSSVSGPMWVGLAVVWLVFAALCAAFMGRRGHQPWAWFGLTLIIGPLAVIPIGVTIWEDGRARPAPATGSGPGGRVLVGVDGSDAAEAALACARELFGGDAATYVLATVVDRDRADSLGQAATSDPEAEQVLRDAARRVGVAGAGSVVLTGEPAAALAEWATANRCRAVVVGRRGRGLTAALTGSVARRLADHCIAPVVIVPDGPVGGGRARVEDRTSPATPGAEGT